MVRSACRLYQTNEMMFGVGCCRDCGAMRHRHRLVCFCRQFDIDPDRYSRYHLKDVYPEGLLSASLFRGVMI